MSDRLVFRALGFEFLDSFCLYFHILQLGGARISVKQYKLVIWAAQVLYSPISKKSYLGNDLRSDFVLIQKRLDGILQLKFHFQMARKGSHYLWIEFLRSNRRQDQMEDSWREYTILFVACKDFFRPSKIFFRHLVTLAIIFAQRRNNCFIFISRLQTFDCKIFQHRAG